MWKMAVFHGKIFFWNFIVVATVTSASHSHNLHPREPTTRNLQLHVIKNLGVF